MSDDRLDDEILAAFMDGTLPEEERARVMRTIARSPDDYATFVEAAAIVSQLEAEGLARTEAPEPRRSTPSRAERSRWKGALRFVVPLLAAASIAGVFLYSNRSRPDDVLTLASLPESIASRGAGALDGALGAGWDEPGWSAVRGGASGSAQSEGASARVGVRFVDYEFASAAEDTSALARSKGALVALLQEIETAGAIVASIERPAHPSDAERREMGTQLRDIVSSRDAFDLGVWLESARLRARSGDTTMLATGSPARVVLTQLRERLGRAAAPDRWSDLLRRIDALLASPAGTDAMRAQLDSAVAALPR